MKVLVACEFSGTVRDAFTALGHDATSCDLQPSLTDGKHYKGDVRDILNDGFDLMIAHPTCRFLTITANRWHTKEHLEVDPWRTGERIRAIEFFMLLALAPIERIAIENPVGVMSSVYRKPDQIIQPWMFGDSAAKQTCLWLKNLPLLVHSKQDDLFAVSTHVDEGDHITWIDKHGKQKRQATWYANAKKADRENIRSKTFQGIANAMAEQWGNLKI